MNTHSRTWWTCPLILAVMVMNACTSVQPEIPPLSQASPSGTREIKSVINGGSVDLLLPECWEKLKQANSCLVKLYRDIPYHSGKCLYKERDKAILADGSSMLDNYSIEWESGHQMFPPRRPGPSPPIIE
ncbi:MAG: hypothetical protein GMKNLPBB_02554 [Myxococcota bacterium]|nr:hypothetical protein [Myxococcota bacterium]